MEKRRNQLILSLLNKKQIIIIMKMLVILNNQIEKEDVALANLIESLLKQTDEEIFFYKKSNWMIV